MVRQDGRFTRLASASQTNPQDKGEGDAPKFSKEEKTMKSKNEKNTNTTNKQYKAIRLNILSRECGFDSFFDIEFVITTRAAAREVAKYLIGKGWVVAHRTQLDDDYHCDMLAGEDSPCLRRIGFEPITPSYFTHLMGYAA